jgi:hypothetical protein
MFGKVHFARLISGMNFEIACNGAKSINRYLDSTEQLNPEIQKQVLSVQDGDGARVIGFVTGFFLTLENPMGIDQSRQGYEIALKRHCNSTPVHELSHAHNGWINTALSIGIPGVMILLLLFFNFILVGYRVSRSDIYGVALFFFASIWFCRGVLDATMQDQMLEMQAFALALLYGLVINRVQIHSNFSAPMT